MRVIVTRPEDSGWRTAERLEALGHTPILLPLTTPVHDPQAADNALATPHAALAITSAEAVQVLFQLGPRLSPFLNEPVFVVGTASAKAAQACGFRNVHCGPGTGIGLAELVAGFNVNSSDPILYLAGSPRSPAFEESLAVRIVPLTVAEIYRMLPLAYEARALERTFVQEQPDAVLIYSRENARLFYQLAASYGHVLKHLLVLGISESIAEPVPLDFRNKMRIAERPDEDSLFALLSRPCPAN